MTIQDRTVIPVIYREARVTDIAQMQRVRHAVRENVLSNPTLVTDKDCEDYITRRGKGWVAMINGEVQGFAIADLQDKNIWALFVDPEWEGMGIGKHLHRIMMEWYFEQSAESVWLSTAPDTRAEKFYTLQGWQVKGSHGNGEVRFELQRTEWYRIMEGNAKE